MNEETINHYNTLWYSVFSPGWPKDRGSKIDDMQNDEEYVELAEEEFSASYSNIDPLCPEPETLVGEALYLLQLCQQDLNMGRESTIWARARRARKACKSLEVMFKPKL